MALILSLDTSTRVCSIAVYQDGIELGHQVYHIQKSHSSLLPGIIKELLKNTDHSMDQLDAISVSAGPGSYTGLRIGTSTAKGLCYGLEIPLLSINSLDSIFESVKGCFPSDTLICSMIDARRMEVFCNLKYASGDSVWSSEPVILDENTFSEFNDQTIILVGDGAEKCHDLYLNHSNIRILNGFYPNAFSIGGIVEQKFQNQDFENLALFEPDYLKEYRTTVPKQKFKF